jgi:hypothetical protein
MRGVDIWQLANVITLIVTGASALHIWSWYSEQRLAYPTLTGIDQRICYLNMRIAKLFAVGILFIFGLGCYELWQGHLVDMRGTVAHPARPASYVVNGTVAFTLIWCYACWGVVQFRRLLVWVLRGDDEARDEQTPRSFLDRKRRTG